MKSLRFGLTVALVCALAACGGGSTKPSTAATSHHQHHQAPTPAAGTDVPVHITTVDAAVSCKEAIHGPNPDKLLSAFRAARLLGSGAEACLAPKARQAYCDVGGCDPSALQASPGPICLYGCFGYRLADLTVLSLTREKNGTLSAYVEALFRNSGGETLRANEALVLLLSSKSIRITYAISTG